MSMFAKTFIIINLVLTLTLVFLMATLLGQKADYKIKYFEASGRARQQADELDVKVRDYEAQRRTLVTTIGRKQTKQSQLSEYVAVVKGRLAELDKQLSALNAEVSELEGTDRSLGSQEQQLSARKGELVSEIETARREREEAIAKQKQSEQALTDLVSKEYPLLSEQGDLDKQSVRLAKETSDLERVVIGIQNEFPNIGIDMTGVPEIVGEVSGVSAAEGLVLVDRGRDHQVRIGYKFTVSRGNEYIGQVQVDRVFKEYSSGRLVRDMARKPIQKGDRITAIRSNR